MLSFRRAVASLSAVGVATALFLGTAFAEFGGPMPNIPGAPAGAGESGIRNAIEKIIIAVLNFLALLAVIVVIIAGIRLILSQGEDEQKEKAKKTIFYALIGLVIILLSRVIVGIVTNYLASQV